MGTQPAAATPGALWRASLLGVLIPLLSAALDLFIAGGVRSVCIRHHGTLGACDPLTSITHAATIGQVLIAIAAAGMAIWAHARRWQKVTPIYRAVACSVLWSAATCLFAAQWLSATP